MAIATLASTVFPAIVVACSTSTPATSACTPGETQPCTGAGGCHGGQACLATGGGFGECICDVDSGNSTVPSDAAVDSVEFTGDGYPSPSDAALNADSAPDGDASTPCMSLAVPENGDLPGPTIDLAPDGGAQDMCFEGWGKFTTAAAPAFMFGHGANAPNQAGWVAYCYPNLLELDLYRSVNLVGLQAAVSCHDGNFHHVAVCFGNKVQLYYDGQLVGATDPGIRPAVANLPLHLGSWGNSPSAGSTTIDEVRISLGQRYTSSFTPPKRLTADTETMFLYHFDEGVGLVTAETKTGGSFSLPAGVVWSPTCP